MVSASLVDHSDQVLVSLGELCVSDDYSDVTFVIEKDRIPAHRAILACRSEYFRALLYGGLEESKQKDINLDDSVIAFKHLLRYLYTGSLEFKDIALDNVLNLLGLAHQYGITAFEKAISDYLYSILSVENVCSILEEIRLLDLQDLIDKCLEFLDQHTHSIMKQESFYNLSYETLICVVDRECLEAKEIDIFQAVQKWCISSQPTEEEKCSLYRKVRFSEISRENLLSTVRPTGVLTTNELLDVIDTQDALGPNRAAKNNHLRRETTDDRYDVIVDLGQVYYINHLRFLIPPECIDDVSDGDPTIEEYVRVGTSSELKKSVLRVKGESSYFVLNSSINFTPVEVQYIQYVTQFSYSAKNVTIEAYYRKRPVIGLTRAKLLKRTNDLNDSSEKH